MIKKTNIIEKDRNLVSDHLMESLEYPMKKDAKDVLVSYFAGEMPDIRLGAFVIQPMIGVLD